MRVSIAYLTRRSANLRLVEDEEEKKRHIIAVQKKAYEDSGTLATIKSTPETFPAGFVAGDAFDPNHHGPLLLNTNPAPIFKL
ncbi:hypothetical protein DXG03_007777 [Asterophora parasitica]|uniref:Uncharacterized protein n=1 Tax=Asterophora parasitica TaxID=117018 RepID=A0A9P7GFV0_9AGAR|nr:hypothetical protein DXG03_007777 [Asterophora parasitica]